MDLKKRKKETVIETIKKGFSLKEDSASHEEIHMRLLDGGKVTGTNMGVLICAMIIASVGLNNSLLRKYVLGFGLQVAISITVL